MLLILRYDQSGEYLATVFDMLSLLRTAVERDCGGWMVQLRSSLSRERQALETLPRPSASSHQDSPSCDLPPPMGTAHIQVCL